jgi:peroxiredoxin (alkyl hydroperoxide reductase subunit C)
VGVLVGREAPDFTASAVLGDGTIVDDFNFKSAINNQYGVLFFYPLDFTFVCPSELIAFDHRLAEFQQRNTVVVGCSVDSQFTHNAWRNTAIGDGGIGPVRYPLVADLTHQICRAYDVETPDGKVAYRGSFLIDRTGVVRHQVVNENSLGRNIDEMLRLIDALQFTEEHGEVCPAGWQKGDSGIERSPAGIADYLSKHADDL